MHHTIHKTQKHHAYPSQRGGQRASEPFKVIEKFDQITDQAFDKIKYIFYNVQEVFPKFPNRFQGFQRISENTDDKRNKELNISRNKLNDDVNDAHDHFTSREGTHF